MLKSHGVLAVLISGFVLGALTCGSAFAADAKSNTQVFASVDVEQAFNNYDKKKQLEAELMQAYDQAKLKLELRGTNKLLTTDEFNQLADLKMKPTPTPADKTKIDELTAASKQREVEFQSLQQKSPMTDADKARLSQLQDQISKTDQSLKDDQGKYEQDLNKRRVDLSTQLMLDVNAAVGTVAKDKNITMVFNKSGDPGFVIYSSYDITDDVLKKLNKK
jgi:Skp family chaperone for outer membrane proteins